MTTEQLTAIEEWAMLPYQTDELAVLYEMPVARLRLAILDPDNPIGQAVNRGRLKAKAELYRKIKVLSDQGSGPAQNMQRQLLDNIEQ